MRLLLLILGTLVMLSCSSKKVAKSTEPEKTNTAEAPVKVITDLKEFVLNYNPEYDEKIPKADYDRGMFILGQVKPSFEAPDQLAGDYWNLAMALIKLRGEKQKIETAFQKAITLDYVKTCAYCKQVVENYPKTKALFQEQIPEVFNHTVEKCLELEKNDPLKKQ